MKNLEKTEREPNELILHKIQFYEGLRFREKSFVHMILKIRSLLYFQSHNVFIFMSKMGDPSNVFFLNYIFIT